MTRMFMTLAALALAASFTLAQTANQPPAGASQPPATATQPPASTAPAPGQAQPSQPAQQPSGRKPPAAQTQEEYKDFQTAAASPDPDALDKAADGFAKKYPNSELRAMLYTRAMMAYQKQGNVDKVIDTARKVTQIDPNDAVANVFIATFLPDKTRDTDADRAQKNAESFKAAQAALANADNIMADPNVPAAQVEANKTTIRSMAYAGLGTVALNNSDWANAEQNFKKSIDIGKDVNKDAITYLRYSIALDMQKKYPQALSAANTALELSPQGSATRQQASDELQRLRRLAGVDNAGGTPVNPQQPNAQQPPNTQTPPPNTPK